MPRYALKIEYEGGPFHGWQRQTSLPSVQGAIEAALAKLERDVHPIAAAGRTDTGVHAIGQVAHCDLSKEWDAFRLSEALNYHLKPLPVAILTAARVDSRFHARFSATARHYHFKLLSRRARTTFQTGLVWQVHHPLDIEAMRAGAGFLIGTHDFTTFRASECQAKSPVKTLDKLDITEHPVPYGAEYHFDLSARSFLHNQVRSFVGTLERVGSGAWAPENVGAALEARQRSRCGPVCPPQGLYLRHVDYDSDPFA